jgi:hypothetical protein
MTACLIVLGSGDECFKKVLPFDFLEAFASRWPVFLLLDREQQARSGMGAWQTRRMEQINEIAERNEEITSNLNDPEFDLKAWEEEQRESMRTALHQKFKSFENLNEQGEEHWEQLLQSINHLDHTDPSTIDNLAKESFNAIDPNDFQTTYLPYHTIARQTVYIQPIRPPEAKNKEDGSITPFNQLVEAATEALNGEETSVELQENEWGG